MGHVDGQFGHGTSIGCIPNAKDIVMTAAKGHLRIVQVLLAQHGVDPNSVNIDGRSPLPWAAGQGHMNVLMKLLAEQTPAIMGCRQWTR